MDRIPFSWPLSVFCASTVLLAVFALPTLAENNANKESAQTFSPKLQEVVLKGGEATQTLSSEQISPWFQIKTGLVFDFVHQTEIINPNHCPFKNDFCSIAFSLRTRSTLHTHSLATLNRDAIKESLESFATQVKKDPVDAKFSIEDGKASAFVLSQDGIELDTDRSVNTLLASLVEHSDEQALQIDLPVRITKPAVDSNDAQKLGINTLIGEGRTNFSGSPKNRIHNFKQAMEHINGTIIPSGSEFSFVKQLGPVDGEHGYLPELVIKNNKTEPEFGGGICQVSSTVFRAAVRSGLKITARRNHAYPVRYYTPYGMDATIYIPNPDLKFINNTSGSILMQASIQGSELIFQFYGTDDGRKVEIDGPHILESNPDGSMKTVFSQKVTDSQGNVLIDTDFRSNYASPSKYPHPGQEPVFTEKPADWSGKQWEAYKKTRP